MLEVYSTICPPPSQQNPASAFLSLLRSGLLHPTFESAMRASQPFALLASVQRQQIRQEADFEFAPALWADVRIHARMVVDDREQSRDSRQNHQRRIKAACSLSRRKSNHQEQHIPRNRKHRDDIRFPVFSIFWPCLILPFLVLIQS